MNLDDPPESGHGTDVFPHEVVRRSRVPAGQALFVMLLTFALVLLLDADGLVRTAERQHLGTGRTVALAIMHPVQDVAHALGLTQPRHWLAEVSGHNDRLHITSTKGVTVATAPPAVSVAPGASTTTTTTTVPSYRTPTSGDPLRVLVAGDSLSGQLGPAFGDVLSGKPANVITDEHVGTGLARPDVVDWPSELQFDMDHDHPEVVVLIFGGNDNQDLRTATGWVYISHYAEWKAEYQRRIAQIMNIVAQPGVSVFWVGLPVMNRPDLQRIVPDVNRMAQIEAGARPGRVTFVDPNTVIAAPDGSFATYLPTAGGGEEAVREPDGVHPTRAGATRIAREVLPLFAGPRHLDGPLPTTSTAPPTTAPPRPTR